MPRCGESGGKKRDGSPCTRAAGWGLEEGHPDAARRCAAHTLEEDDRRESIKAELLARFDAYPDEDVAEAARHIESSVTVIHRLRKLDPVFDGAVTEHVEGRMQATRNANVASSLYRRLVNPLGKASAAHYALYLLNRDADNWKDKRQLNIAGHDGGPLGSELEDARESLEGKLAVIAARQREEIVP